jgi:uncharacterized protein (DUF302 family)
MQSIHRPPIPRWSLALAALLTAMVLRSQAVQADPLGSVVLADSTTAEAVTRIKEGLEAQGLEIVAVIDHAQNAASVGLELPPTTLILWRAQRLELRLADRAQGVTIDLPSKYLIWQKSEDDPVRLTYNTAEYLTERHDIETRDSILRRLSPTLERFGRFDYGLIDVASTQDFAATVESVQEVLEADGFRIPLVIDYRTLVPGGQRLNPTTLVIFGNPNVGTQFMTVEQSIGLDLPQKFLIREDDAGGVTISYNDIAYLVERHDVDVPDSLVTAVSNALAALASAAANP